MASLRGPFRRSRNQTSVVNFVNQRQWHSGENGRRNLVRGRLAQAKSLYRRDLIGHFGCVNAIEFSQGNSEWIVSGGDDRRVLVWNVQEALSGIDKPRIMKGQHNSNIFCLSFDQSNSKIFSGGNDEQVVVHDFQTGATVDVFPHDDVVYGLSVDPNNDNVFASAADDGKVRIYDIREQPKSDDQPFCLAACISSMHAVIYNPVEPRLLLTANNDEGVGLWDIRKPKKCLLKYGGDLGRKQQHDCMSVRLNHLGTQLIALYRRRPLMLYNIDSPTPVCKFNSSQTEYLNCCTMKSCCFAGDKDQYVLSGSDLFHVFMWEVPHMDKPTQGSTVYHVHSTHIILKSHRSIVNQVRYSDVNHLLVSSGVEKVVKIWSPFPLCGGDGDLMDENSSSRPERVRYTQEQSMNIVLRHDMMHDYSNGSVEEDPHMMAFFDSLIQAGGDPWSSDDDSSLDFIHLPFTGRSTDDSEDRSDSSPFSGNERESVDLGDILTNGTVPRRDNVLHQSDSSSSSSSSMSWDDFNERWVHHPKSSCSNDVNSSDSDSQSVSGGVGEIHQRQLTDPPYRARAKTAVKRLRQMRARIENSDTSDSDENNPTDRDRHKSDDASTSTDKTCENGETSSSVKRGAEESVGVNDMIGDHDVSHADNWSAMNDINGNDKSSEKTDDCCTLSGSNVMLSVNNGNSTCPDLSNSAPQNMYKTITNGKGHVPDNAESRQEKTATTAVQNVKGENSVANRTRETTLHEEVNGNHLCVASTSTAVSGDTDVAKDCTNPTNSGHQSAKTKFKKLKNRNESSSRRQYRRHNRSSGEED